jgi:hypothetical protein
VFTDERGRFSLDVPAGVTLSIVKAGYAQEVVRLTSVRGARTAGDIRIAMNRGAAIIGRVTDGIGVPVVAATVVVRLTSPATDEGAPRLFTAATDDLGEFRVGGLPEGEFQVGARSSPIEGSGSPRALEQDTEAPAAVAFAGASVRIRPGDSVDVGQLAVQTSGVVVSGGAVGPARKLGRLAGQVRDSRGRAMKVVVRLRSGGLSILAATSDAQGRFRFDRVPPGSYLAEVSRPGVPTIQYGQRLLGQPGTPIDIRENATVNGIDFVLATGTAIAGAIWDEYGEPVQGAAIRALQIQRVDGRSVAMPVPGIQMRMSDDRGGYRLFGLLPGKYLVVADIDGVSVPGVQAARGGYAPSFYPGVTSALYALPVALDRGDAIGVDFSFQSDPAAHVAGTVRDSTGAPVHGGVLMAVSQRSGSIMLEPKLAMTSADGAFAFENVPPGDYVVQAVSQLAGYVRPAPAPDTPPTPPPVEFGMQYVTVTDADPATVVLRTSPGALLRGRLNAEGPASIQLPPSLTVYPVPTDFDLSPLTGSGAAGLTMKPDGSFEVTGVTGPRRFALMGKVDGWYVKGARVGRVEAMDTPFDFGMAAREFDNIEIVVSPSPATISGSVARRGGAAVADCAVLLFSTDSQRWYRFSQALRLERPSQDREFRIASLPPGSYYLVALSDSSDLITSGSWREPATLEKLRPLATRVTVQEGELRVVNLELASDR